MNIFYLDKNPELAANYHCDKHVCKMIVEYAQLLSTAHHVLDGEGFLFKYQIYKKTHENHPSALWARENRENYRWLFQCLLQLLRDYEERYNKEHKTKALLRYLIFFPKQSLNGDRTDPPQCMPDQYKSKDAVQAYRNYYIGEKGHFAKWKNAVMPPWWILE